MKIRNGFVSNSSSSSFICDVCGTIESGFDASLEDFGMVECVNGHTFCEGEGVEGYEKSEKDDDTWEAEWLQAVKDEETNLGMDEWIEEQKENYDEDENKIPAEGCKICQMQVIRDSDLLRFIYEKYKTNRQELEVLMRESKFKILDC